jgi:GMP synthase-like glutamine amidotransferase
MMITLFQHAPGEAPGAIMPHFTGLGIPFRIVPLYKTNEVPEKKVSAPFIILGGFMSVNDEREYPFFRQEKVLVRGSSRDTISLYSVPARVPR